MNSKLLKLKNVEFVQRVESFLKRYGIKSLSPDSTQFEDMGTCECCKCSHITFRSAASYNPATKQVLTFDKICWDCILYIEYGDLPFAESEE